MRHVIRVMRRHDLTNKKTITKTGAMTKTKAKTKTMTKTFGEDPEERFKRPVTIETFDQSDEET